ncbi:cytidylate kinase family protein [Segatella paludivivens]|uniref:cytidylate kinase family protein n=1 Tax=Segatella paludivivens TaxID=185294 RepID=UPI00036FC3B5|nr:cytidylate kinase family protein [Segatella paludivivens]
MKSARSGKELLRRYVVFIIALFIIAFGTSLSIRANLGSSPISCPPYVLSLVPGTKWSMGKYVICMHIFFILSQILLLRKNYHIIQLLQIVVSFIFGFYTDVTMWMTGLFMFDSSIFGYVMRCIQLCVGGGLLAYGIAIEVKCDVLTLAGEGFPLAISKVVHADFGKVKMFSDTGLVVIGAILCFIFIGGWHWDMIGVGTLFSMFYVGFLIRKFSPYTKWLEPFFNATPLTVITTERNISASPLVITISREYGSGGHEVGEKLAKKLGIKLYDKYLIDKTADELGCSYDFVKENEQNISTAKLWKLIFTDKSIPMSMNPSEDDAIFVSQSRTIKKLADNESCVIVGRCANWVLKDDKNSFHVFVCSDIKDAVGRVVGYINSSPEKAKEQILKTNKARANHYWQYTGGYWTDARNYDLVVNSSKISIDNIVEIICNSVKK